MSMVKRTLIFASLIWLILILSAPKERLYYLLEHTLAKDGIFIANESLKSQSLGLEINRAKISHNRFALAEITKAKFLTLLFYSKILIKELRLSQELQTLLGIEKIDSLRLIHSLMHPMTVFIEAHGDFGTISGSIDLKSRYIRLWLINPKRSPEFARYFKRLKEGMLYEQSF